MEKKNRFIFILAVQDDAHADHSGLSQLSFSGPKDKASLIRISHKTSTAAA